MRWKVRDRVQFRRSGAIWAVTKVEPDGSVHLESMNPGSRRAFHFVSPDDLLPMTVKQWFVSDRDRFLSHLAFDGDCVVWTGTLSRSGYGHFKFKGRYAGAHRWFWEFENGPVPAGLELDHLCRNRACVNLTHLEPVTPRENVRRGMSPIAKGMRQTHCIHGHPFEGDNLLIRRNGQRACRTCCRENSRRKRARARALREQLPMQRLQGMHPDTRIDHRWDA